MGYPKEKGENPLNIAWGGVLGQIKNEGSFRSTGNKVTKKIPRTFGKIEKRGTFLTNINSDTKC